ncbi:MAG: alpha/beta fold hydrolase [Opitutaceae bacterium]|nr:alpha/beta fold hydrolase [Opitutaceae bacterium]
MKTALFASLLSLFLGPALLAHETKEAGPDAVAAVTIPYGSNPAAAHQLRCDDATIYYEVYGTGKPLLLLHGGLFGYIDEFADFIPELAQHYQVIAIATRGHGRSELGAQPLTYQLFARDALAVLAAVTQEKACVLGFSDGAITTYAMALQHPEHLERVIAIGGGPLGIADSPTQQEIEEAKMLSGEGLAKAMPDFVAGRRKLMPQPERWDEFVDRLKALYLSPAYLDRDQLRSVQVPFLLVQGEHDPYASPETFLRLYRTFPLAQLAIVPGCGHLVLRDRQQLARELILHFLGKPDLHGAAPKP